MEDPKPARRAWIRFGLDRKFIDEFVYYNEQTRGEILEELIKGLKSGKKIYTFLVIVGFPPFVTLESD